MQNDNPNNSKSSLVLDEHMMRIPKEHFNGPQSLEYDLFIRLGSDHFVRVGRNGEFSNVHKMSVMNSDQVKHFYIHRGEHSKYLEQMVAKAQICNMAGQHFFSQVENVSFVIQAIHEQIITSGLSNESYKHVKEMSRILVELVQYAPPGVVAFLSGLNRIGEAHVRHALAVSIVSMVIGKKANLSNDELNDLCIAGLMHDIGVLKLNADLVNKCFENMTEQEIKDYQSHAVESVALLRNISQVNGAILNAVYEHHENELGEGYPRKMKSDTISKLGKIISMVNYFCEHTLGDPQHNQSMKPLNALNYIENIEGQPFAGEYFTFLKQIINESSKLESLS